MTSTSSLTPYPWTRIERVTRASLEAARVLSEQVGLREVAARLCAGLAAWSGEPASFDCRRSEVAQAEPREPLPRLLFRGVGTQAAVLACIDPRLCLRLGQRLTGGKAAPIDPLQPIDAALLGAVAALGSHLIDAGGFESPLRIGWGRLGEPQGPRYLVEGTLRWGSGRFELALLLELPAAPTRSAPPRFALAALGDLPLTLRVRVGHTRLSAAELAALHVGAVFLPGPELELDPAGNGRGTLGTGESPWAYPVALVGGRQIVLGPRAVNRDIDEHETVAVEGDAPGLERVLAQASLTVHLEVGSVTLSAERLARLRPGDVLETPEALGERASLRVAGRVVARGELVSVDGQVGLRITELLMGEAQ